MTKDRTNMSSKNQRGPRQHKDAIDLFLEEQEKSNSGKNLAPLSKSQDNYDLYNFLDHELNRLSKLESFFSKKLPNMQTHDQQGQLLDEQYELRDSLRNSLIEKFNENDSKFRIRFKQIFDQCFKKG